MTVNLRNRIILIVAIVIAALFFTFPLEKNINLGLDLKGGMHLVLKVDVEKLEEDAKSDAVLRAIEILRNRIDSMGVGEPVIQRQGKNEILIQLPGITDRDKAVSMIGRVAQLAFHMVSDEPGKMKEALDGNVPEGYQLKYIKKEDDAPILIDSKVALNGETVADARVDYDSQGFNQPNISLKFNGEGAKQFATLTKNNVNRRLAIVLDGEVLSAPNIKEAIMGGTARIDGMFTYDEASVLALSLRSGALPAPMHIEEERTIGPLLGKDSINSGINATVIGGAFVLLFMLVYYLKAGLISDIALALNLLLIFGLMGLVNKLMPNAPLTLTLPGIAGIILTLGMAVDANVLINERIREELQNDRPLKAAVNSGFAKALKAIIDSNVTTFIAALMLFQFGSGPIKGFAVTLSIGLAVSLFTALFVTRTIFLLAIQIGILKTLPMLSFFTKTKIDFVSKRFIAITLSSVMVIASFVVLHQKKESAYGIDFAGGQIQEYQFQTALEADEIRAALKEANIEEAVIQQFAQNPRNVMIKSASDTDQKVRETFRTAFPDNSFEMLRIEKVGPVVGKALRKAAVMAIVFALGGILLFVGFRFKHFDFATAGVIALLHDVIVTFGILLIMGRQIDLLVITALLTIAGYSINDTIIIYDRVRENLVKYRRKPLAEIINESINQTLGRTILTTVTTLMVVITLFLRGGEVLNSFALCLIIGFVAGTYSTIFIASPLVLAWEKKKKK